MSTTDPESILEDIADEFISCLRAGQNPSIKSYSQRHPSLSDEISDMLSSIELMEQMGRCESDSREQANAQRVPTPVIEKLGDFDIIREIGRGGMGVVYEALDRTLQRHVALKVLNDSALTTQKHVDRFRRESRLAAQLHHTNIVSVFGVGEEDGKHFYAMQYVEGVSVQDILDGLQQLPNADREFNFDQRSAVDGLDVAAELRAGQFAEARSTHINVKQYSASGSTSGVGFQTAVAGDSRRESSRRLSSAFDKTSELSGSTESGNDSVQRVENGDPPSRGIGYDSADNLNVTRAPRNVHDNAFGQPYWRSVARIGMQVADALHYAHVNGILHRDIKPANLLFDSNGTVWVADFGLAKLTETDDLTDTGDAVGTLKYMAPEQLAGIADARTDIYALGLTLYELLTLRPVCDGETYKALFAQKQDSAHAAPRKINPAIPRDLETIVQKTLEWEADKRYASSRELTEDLQRFLDDLPIRARRVTLAERAWRWCRRNRALATLGTMVACLFVLLPIVLGWAYIRESNQNERMENTLDVVLDGFDELFGSYLENDVATAAALTEASGDETAQLAPAMLTKDTAGVLEKMLVVYDRLAAENAFSTNVGLAVESAKARRRVGDLYQQLGQFTKASEAYEDAAERYSELSERNATHHIDVARVYQAIGALHEQRQNLDLARADYENAIHVLKQAPRNDEAKFELARTHYLLGKQQIIEGVGPKQQLGGRSGPRPFAGRGGPDYRRGPNDLGSRESEGLVHAGEEVERLAHLDSAINQVNQLRAEDPNNTAYRFLLALCLREKERGGQLENTSETNATELLGKLAEQFPNVPRYRYELCETYRNFGRYALDVGGDERLEKLQLARKLGEQLVEEQRDAAPYRINLAHIYAFLGVEYGKLGDCRQAEKFTRLSIATHESVTEDFPGLASLSYRLSTNDKTRLGGWLLHLRRYEELVELLQPLGDQLFKKVDAASKDKNDSLGAARSTLRECRELLLPAYEAVGDEVGYLVALAWIDPTNGPPHPPDFGPPGIGPSDFGPMGSGPPNRITMAMSYDANDDGRITKDEVSPLMGQEWFRRADTNQNGNVDRTELIELLH